MQKNCLIVFVKFPEARGVKSRLASRLGERQARQLYRRFVEDLLDNLDEGDYFLKLFFYPPCSRKEITRWLGGGRSYEPQSGEDLGERMKNAFEKCFSDGFERAILIGSDSPDLPRAIVEAGFTALASRDAVIGPACDGGYYLIGFRAATFLPAPFSDIAWSTAEVLKDTLAVLDGKGLKWAALPTWGDIDTYEDLKRCIEINRKTKFAQSRTVRYALSRCGKIHF
jgi:rSAM/selenodomain-associated transferase 1